MVPYFVPQLSILGYLGMPGMLAAAFVLVAPGGNPGGVPIFLLGLFINAGIYWPIIYGAYKLVCRFT